MRLDTLNVLPRLGAGALSVLLAASLLLSGCGSTSDILPDRKVDYKKQRVAEQDLEVPPDLSSSTISDSMPVPGVDAGGGETFSDYKQRRGAPVVAAKGGAVLPDVDNITVKRDGDQRWLEIELPPDDVWPRVVSFWRKSGVLLVEQDPTVGVMKTDWLENRADIKQGFLTDFFRKALDGVYASATRDQFRVRLEPGQASGSTDLYVTHRGMEEVLASTAGNPDSDASYWAPRANDPGLEAEMLRRIMVYLGVAEQQAAKSLVEAKAQTAARSELVKNRDGSAALLVKADYGSAWRLVGVAVERVGFAVEDRDRSAGIYYVRYDDPTKDEEKGFFDKMAFWRDDAPFDEETQYQVYLQEQGDETRAIVRNSAGVQEVSDTGARILTLIQEQIR